MRLALHHPVADLLLDYASGGYPVNTGQPWSREEMQAAFDKGPRVSALEPAAMEQLAKNQPFLPRRHGACSEVGGTVST